jgi:hypothetical protein
MMQRWIVKIALLFFCMSDDVTSHCYRWPGGPSRQIFAGGVYPKSFVGCLISVLNIAAALGGLKMYAKAIVSRLPRNVTTQ